MNWLLCEILFACVVSARPMPLDELTYRTVLFDHYQGDNFSALVDVMVAREQGRTGVDPLRFDLALGSFSFDQGMYRNARRTFDAIPADQLTDTDRLRLAFHQSRLHLEQQDWGALNGTLATLEAAETALDVKPHPESVFMRSELALAQGNPGDALTLLEALDDDQPYRAYGLFNTAVVLAGAGETTAALDTLEVLDGLEVSDQETADLKQRGRLASAWLVRESDRAADAQGVLAELPESSRYRDSALTAYGNLAMSREDYALAARIWLTLKEDKRWLSSGAIARIGFPLALHQLSEPDSVLSHYRAAADEFESRLAVLNDVSKRMQDTTWVRELATAVQVSARSPESTVPLPPDSIGAQIGNQEWLNWLAAEDVHAVLREWQSLQDMRAWLRTLPPTLEAFAEVSAEQRRRTQALKSALHDEGLQQRRDELAVSAREARARLSAIDDARPEPTAAWMMPLLEPGERDALEQLLTLEANVDVLPEDQQDRARARIKRLIGVWFWRVADDFPQRRWKLERKAQAVEKALADTDAVISRIANAEQNYAATVLPRFDAWRERATGLLVQVDRALVEREEMLAELIRGRLHRETEQIGQYLFLARVAIAEVSDELAAVDHTGLKTAGVQK